MRSPVKRIISPLAGLKGDVRELWGRISQRAHPVTGVGAMDQRDLLWLQILRELGLNRRHLAIYHPGVEGNLASKCAQCSAKQRCRAELEAGTAVANLRQFCPGADSWVAIRDYAAPWDDIVAKRYETRSTG